MVGQLHGAVVAGFGFEGGLSVHHAVLAIVEFGQADKCCGRFAAFASVDGLCRLQSLYDAEAEFVGEARVVAVELQCLPQHVGAADVVARLRADLGFVAPQHDLARRGGYQCLFALEERQCFREALLRF